MRYKVKHSLPPAQCHECGEPIRRPKRFCSDECIVRWSRVTNGGITIFARGAAQVATERSKRRAITHAL